MKYCSILHGHVCVMFCQVPDADPVPAAPDTVQPSFDAVNGYLAEVMALHKTREQMLGIFFTLEEDSVERETMRIQLRKMTGQMKKLVENITLMLTDMETLRDKKQEARQTQTR